MKSGFLILETLISVVLLGIIVVSIFPTLNFMLMRVKRSSFDAQASQLLQEGTEISQNVLFSGWDNYYTGVTYHPVLNLAENIWELEPGPESGIEGKFDRSIELISVCRIPNNPSAYTTGDCLNSYVLDPFSLVVRTTVSWPESGRIEKIQSNLLLTSRISD